MLTINGSVHNNVKLASLYKFVVGSLGAWDYENEKAFKALKFEIC